MPFYKEAIVDNKGGTFKAFSIFLYLSWKPLKSKKFREFLFHILDFRSVYKTVCQISTHDNDSNEKVFFEIYEVTNLFYDKDVHYVPKYVKNQYVPCKIVANNQRR